MIIISPIRSCSVKDNQLRSCKEEFEEIERQNVKYQKYLKHIKQKT